MHISPKFFAATVALTCAAVAIVAFSQAQPALAESEQPHAKSADSVPKTASPVAANQAAAGSAVNAVPVVQTELQRGAYLVKLGDCIACHTQKGGQPFAGGRPLKTPFGTVLSANLTPDDATGIGKYTADTFYRALHEGKDKDGRYLYPAFPYNYYTRVTREDSDAMFGYFRSLVPVSHPLDRNQLPFPFNIRASMIAWNLLFLDKGTYEPVSRKSAEWNRGAYLVEGLGHCQACHTPKNKLGAAKSDEAFRGGMIGNWFAPNVTQNQRVGIGAWSAASLREFLRDGRNVHSAATAEMGEMVAYSTSQMTDADLSAVVTYLRDVPASPEQRYDAPEQAVMRQGEAIWRDQCTACHRVDGKGVPRYFPPLQGNAALQQRDPTTVFHYILAGASKIATDGAPTRMAMPAFGWKLSDQQVAAVATYTRNSWGNTAAPVSAQQVAEVRSELAKDGSTKTNHPQPAPMTRPGPATLAPAGTSSLDNGTPQAGRAALK